MSTPPNMAAVEQFLTKEGIEYTYGGSDNESGWVLEILQETIEGKQLDDLVKLVDTQQNVSIYVLKNVGMVIGTEGSV